MNQISDKILNTIKGKHIKPKPKWQFIFKRILIIVAAVFSVIIGALLFSVILFRLVNNDWDMMRHLPQPPIVHFFQSLPYIWIVLVILFLILAYYNARHAKGAYRYQAYWFVIGIVLISIVLGSVLYSTGIGPRLYYSAGKLPYIKKLMYDRDKVWTKAEEGFIAGEVTEMLSGIGMFEIKDLNDYKWIVRPGEKYYPPPPQFVIEEGVMVRIYGEKIDKEIFEAMKVLPYEKGPGIRKGKIDIKEAYRKYNKCKR